MFFLSRLILMGLNSMWPGFYPVYFICISLSNGARLLEGGRVPASLLSSLHFLSKQLCHHHRTEISLLLLPDCRMPSPQSCDQFPHLVVFRRMSRHIFFKTEGHGVLYRCNGLIIIIS